MTHSDVIRLGTHPSAVEELRADPASGGVTLWVKRDDAASAVYGGNKVRKLEHLLGAARAEGKSRILTLGAAGSHQVVATALHGKREGFVVEAVLVPQPGNEHARGNLRVAVAHGLRAVAVSSWPAAPALLATRLGRDAYVVPLGGSNAIGSLGFVDAAAELAAQVMAGLLPEPEAIVLALGSGGTAAGLAVGLERAGLRTRVVGVIISEPARVLEVLARRVARKTAELVGLAPGATARAVARLAFDRHWLGRGYGHPTAEGDRATNEAKAHGLVLDGTYTGKAFASALSLARTERVLYWHTLSSAPLAPLLASAPPLPPDLAALFR